MEQDYFLVYVLEVMRLRSFSVCVRVAEKKSDQRKLFFWEAI